MNFVVNYSDSNYLVNFVVNYIGQRLVVRILKGPYRSVIPVRSDLRRMALVLAHLPLISPVDQHIIHMIYLSR